MRRVTEFPRTVKIIENIWIPMSDGAKLAARLWLPEDAEDKPVPGLLEYIPYRKRDLTRHRDEPDHHYLAGHGYACLRVDMRGSGDSDGVLTDEYLPQELADGVDVINWIASQTWCTGKVGMFGISWGGFNALQIAGLRPKPLKAIITVCSTDDRYADDVHYMGGCLLGDNLSWASTMFARNSTPPDPEIVGDRWRDMWMARLEGAGLWVHRWLEHQRRDEYWKHGSVCEDFSQVQCAVMAVSGWADGYSNAVFRLLEGLEAPRKGLIGPWSHRYPHTGLPGPAVGFLQESLRWWNHWLKEDDTGMMDEPVLRVWEQDYVPPTTSYDTRPGRWIVEDCWPSENVAKESFPFCERRLGKSEEQPAEKSLTVKSPLTVGLFAGKWCSYSAAPDLPGDQREEDGGSLVFDTDPLEETVDILGIPTVDLKFSVDRRVAMVAARLSDIAPDHKVTRVTYGLLNLTHRDSHEKPVYLEPGEKYKVTVKLNGIAHRFQKNHRIRLSLSTSYWPLAWTPPETTMLTVHTGASCLNLPVRPVAGEKDEAEPFPLPETGAALNRTMLRPAKSDWAVHRDLATDVSTLEVVQDRGKYRIEDIDFEVDRRAVERYSIHSGDAESAAGETEWTMHFRRADWDVRTETKTRLTCNKTHFIINATLDAYQGEDRVFSKVWNKKVHRDFL